MSPSIVPAAPQETARLRCGGLALKREMLLPRVAVSHKGPVPHLLRRGRLPLPLWLLLGSAATKEQATVVVRHQRPFAERALDLKGPRGTVTSSFSRAVDVLQRMQLITVLERRHGYLVVQLLSLDGLGNPYEMPRREQKVVYVPGILFHNHWHTTLSPAALTALLIAWTEESYQYGKVGRHSWEKPRSEISQDYGLAESTWSEGKKELQGWGILEYQQMRSLRRGSGYLIDRYTVHREVLEQPPGNTERVVATKIVRKAVDGRTGQVRQVYQWHHERVPPRDAGQANAENVVPLRPPPHPRRNPR